jgi:hypothetical protein
MIARIKRDLATRLLRRLMEGQISNDDFTDGYPQDADDRALGAVYEGLWGFWDDLRTNKLTTKHKLSPERCQVFERCIAFLESDLEYEWPPIQRISFTNALLRVVGLRSLANDRANKWERGFKALGKWEVWPFIREGDYTSHQKQ